MTKKEQQERAQQLINIYSGILFNNRQFDIGNNEKIIYRFDCPEFVILKDKYNLEEVAGSGSDFDKAKRLLHYFATRLAHSSWYDNSIPCNSLDLLEYSLNRPERGINCLNKSKILQECCLAMGIYARRVCMKPYSPYDFDNHVVTEIYDRKLNKWIMLDVTTDGLFVNENGIPLSLLEIREGFANSKFITYIYTTDNLNNLRKLKDKYVEHNAYICKNLFGFYIDQNSTFGETERFLTFVPINYSIKENLIANVKYRIKNLPEEHKKFILQLEEQLEQLKNYKENERTSIDSMMGSPIIF